MIFIGGENNNIKTIEYYGNIFKKIRNNESV